MPRFDKWLTGPSAEAPVDRAARRAISSRLRAVAWYLDRVKQDDAEAVHQLRIWTRRSTAALDLFGAALPQKRRRWMRRTMRTIRRTAGRVRDCDVLLARLATEGRSRELERIERKLHRQRRDARRELKALRRKLLRGDRLARKSAELQQRVAWPKRHSSRTPPPLGPWCREQLAPLAEEFFRLAEGDLASDHALHEFRLAGKRLRYALELAAPGLRHQPLRLFYEDLTVLQDRLGEVCDRLAAATQYQEWLAGKKRVAAQRLLHPLLDDERRKLDKTRRQFLRWWTAARRGKFKRRWEAV